MCNECLHKLFSIVVKVIVGGIALLGIFTTIFWYIVLPQIIYESGKIMNP